MTTLYEDLYNQDWAYLIEDDIRLAKEMTLPDERYRALRLAETLLLDLCNCRQTPRVPRAVRERARGILRHYPSQYHLKRLAEKSPDVIMEQIEPLTRLVMVYNEEKTHDDAS